MNFSNLASQKNSSARKVHVIESTNTYTEMAACHELNRSEIPIHSGPSAGIEIQPADVTQKAEDGT